MSNSINQTIQEEKKEYLEDLAWELFKKGVQNPLEDKRILLLDVKDAEYLYEQWGRMCAGE